MILSSYLQTVKHSRCPLCRFRKGLAALAQFKDQFLTQFRANSKKSDERQPRGERERMLQRTIEGFGSAKQLGRELI